MNGSKPRVFIIIDSVKLGGPGKGLLQYLERLHGHIDYLIVNFTQGGNDRFEFVEVARARGHRIELIEESYRFNPLTIVRALRMFREGEYNIIQSHGYKGHVIALFISRLTGCKWLAMAHGWTRENIKILAYNALERLLLRFPDYAVAVSPSLYFSLEKQNSNKRKLRLLLNAVDEKEIPFATPRDDVRKRYRLSQNDFVIGVFGRFSPEKGHEYILYALTKIINQFPRIRLLLIGEGQEREKLHDIVRKNGLEQNVIFCGYQRYIGDYYAAVDLVVLPSLSEGLPNVVLEAMVLGKPVLATKVGGVPEIIQHDMNGWLVTPGSVTELEQALRRLLDDRQAYDRIQKNTKSSLMPKFCPDARARSILAMYHDMLDLENGTRTHVN